MSLTAAFADEKFRLVKTKKDSEQIERVYEPINSAPMKVNYSYSITMGDHALVIEFNANDSSIKNIKGQGFDTTDEKIIKKFKIPNLKVAEGCSYKGKAIISVKSLVVYTPIKASEIISLIKITDVLHVSKPKFECS